MMMMMMMIVVIIIVIIVIIIIIIIIISLLRCGATSGLEGTCLNLHFSPLELPFWDDMISPWNKPMAINY